MEEDKYRPPSVDEAPWLIIGHKNGRRIEKQTFCTMSPLSSSTSKSYIKTIVELDSKSILNTSFGWLILRDRINPTIYSLWNPVTFQSVILPPLLDEEHNEDQLLPNSIILTSAPNDSNKSGVCVLLVFFRGYVFSCRPFDRECCKWYKQTIEHDGLSVEITTAVICNDDNIFAYAMVYSNDDNGGRHRMFARMKLDDKVDNSSSLLIELSSLQPPQDSLEFRVYPLRRSYLVDVCGVVYAVHMMMRQGDEFDNFDIHKAFVWKLDPSKLEWILVDSLGDRALLLGDCGCTWCPTTPSQTNTLTGFHIEGNCIYFVVAGSRTMHWYRLRDNSYGFLLPPANFRGPFVGPAWFMPHDHQRLSAMIEHENTVYNWGEEMQQVEDVNEACNILFKLPEDLQISVANQMHLFDYVNFRVTCKTFHSKLSKPKWRRGSLYPLLMSLKNNKLGICELWDIFENITHSVTTPHPPEHNSTIEFCQGGCLLMRVKDDESLQCLDPFTGTRFEYPPRDANTFFWGYAFSSSPFSSPDDCITIGIFAYGFRMYICCFRAGIGQWVYRILDLNPNTDIGFDFNLNSSPRYYDGAFYFISSTGKLGVFKMVNENWNWSWNVYDSPLTVAARSTVNSCYIVELNGHITSVIFQHVGKKVQVFMFEMAEERWVELHDLGAYVLFLSPASSFGVVEKYRTMRNRIYLSKCVGDGVVYYSLDTRKYHVLGKRDVMDDFYGMSTQSFCCWV